MFNLRGQKANKSVAHPAGLKGQDVESYSVADDQECSVVVPPIESELESLVSSVAQQSVDISCEFSRWSDIAGSLDLLRTRVATLQPQVKRLMAQKGVLETELAHAVKGRESAVHSAAEIDAELKHYRPLAHKLDEDLRVAAAKVQQAQSQIIQLESQMKTIQGENNELLRKLGSAETRVVRFKEENNSLKQKALEQASLFQSLLRESAELRSSLAGAHADVERQEQINADLTEKLVAARETGAKLGAQAGALDLRHAHATRELQIRLTESEEREQQLITMLSAIEKKLQDSEIRQSGLISKNELLMRMSEQLREEMGRRVDHAAMLEASNRQLLEAMSSKTRNDEGPERNRKSAQTTPVLRAVNTSE